MKKINTKLAIPLSLCLLTGCQWHNATNAVGMKFTSPLTTKEGIAQAPIKAAKQEVPTGPIDIAEAIARGLTYNAAHRAKALERIISAKRLGTGPFALFPKVTANANLNYRSNPEAGVASRLTPTVLPRTTEHFTGADQLRGNAAIEATWSLLDLGLSALNNKIELGNHNAGLGQWQFETRRLTTDIIRAFWRLHVHQKHHKTRPAISRQVNNVLAKARQTAKDPDKRIENLFIMRGITDLYRYLLALERTFADAPAAMNHVLNLPQTTTLKVTAQKVDLPLPRKTPKEWIEAALTHSPELINARNTLAQHKIRTQRDIVALLPSVTAVLGIKLDTNSYSLNSNWLNLSLRGTWNLLRLLEVPKIRRTAQAKADHQRQLLEKAAGLVARKSIIANVSFQDASYEMRHATNALNIQRKIVTDMAAQFKRGEKPEHVYVTEQILLALASIRHGIADVEFKTAQARMAETHGLGLHAHFQNLPAPTPENFKTLLAKTEAYFNKVPSR